MKDTLPELKYSKSACGVEFMLNVADSTERPAWFGWKEKYATDFFEFYFFRSTNGHVILDGEKIMLADGCILIISPISVRSITLRLPHEIHIPEDIAGKPIGLAGDIAATLDELVK